MCIADRSTCDKSPLMKVKHMLAYPNERLLVSTDNSIIYSLKQEYRETFQSSFILKMVRT